MELMYLRRRALFNSLTLKTSTSGSFVTDVVAPLKKLLLTLEPIQSGSGTPSPDNVRPISGHTEVVTIVSPTTDAEDGTTYTTTLGRTVYGGTLDVVSGELVVDRAMVVFDGSSDEIWYHYAQGTDYYCFDSPINDKKTGWQTSICNSFPNVTSAFTKTEFGIYCDHPTNNYVYFRPPNNEVDTLAKWRDWLSQNPLQLVYELATPQTYQLDPQQINSLVGQNNIIAEDGAEIAEITYWSH